MNTAPHPLEDKKRLLGIGTTSIAAAGLAALLPAIAQAQVQAYTPASPVSFAIPVNDGDTGYFYWDAFSGNASNTYIDGYLTLSSSYFASFGGFNSFLEPACSFAYNLSISGSGSPGAQPAVLQAGDVIDGSSSFIDYYANPGMLPLGNSYFGFRFGTADENNDTAGYGWVEFNNDGTNYSLVSWGTGMGVSELTVGSGTPVPEPASTAAIGGLFFAGIVAFVRWKKHRALRLSAA